MQKFAVIGNPASQSKSPAMHNAAFAMLGLDAQYEAISVKPAELKKFFERLHTGEISGINITIPHKQAAMNFVDELTPLAKQIGAINTVYHKGNQLIGDNTDAPGFILSLKEELNFSPKEKNCVIIGAGGAARAVVSALTQNGAKKIIIINRSIDKANELALLASPSNCKALAWSEITPQDFSGCDLVVNASSLGMGTITWPRLDFVEWLSPKTVVSDIVYHPKVTALTQACETRGLRVQNGLGMLLYQGVIAFELFTQQKAPVEIMRMALMTSDAGHRTSDK